jgi:hypothetical protein
VNTSKKIKVKVKKVRAAVAGYNPARAMKMKALRVKRAHDAGVADGVKQAAYPDDPIARAVGRKAYGQLLAMAKEQHSAGKSGLGVTGFSAGKALGDVKAAVTSGNTSGARALAQDALRQGRKYRGSSGSMLNFDINPVLPSSPGVGTRTRMRYPEDAMGPIGVYQRAKRVAKALPESATPTAGPDTSGAAARLIDYGRSNPGITAGGAALAIAGTAALAYAAKKGIERRYGGQFYGKYKKNDEEQQGYAGGY